MTFFEFVGIFVALLFAATGGSLYLYCTLIGARVIWRRLTGGE